MQNQTFVYAIIAAGALVVYNDSGANARTETGLIDRQVSAFASRLRSDSLRQLVRLKARELNAENKSAVQEGAVLFFCDLHARNVLLACLGSGDDVLANSVVGHCMAVFDVESLPGLYAIALAKTPPRDPVPDIEDYQVRVAREELVRKISLYAANLLKVEPPKFPASVLSVDDPPLNRADLRDWWLKVLRAGEKNETRNSSVRKALLEIEKFKVK